MPAAPPSRSRATTSSARSRLGDRQGATAELGAYLRGTKPRRRDAWLSELSRFLLGERTEQDLLNAAGPMDRTRPGERTCEASFFAATRRLLQEDRAAA